jgi:hypothetical protein
MSSPHYSYTEFVDAFRLVFDQTKDNCQRQIALSEIPTDISSKSKKPEHLNCSKKPIGDEQLLSRKDFSTDRVVLATIPPNLKIYGCKPTTRQRKPSIFSR